MLGLFACIAIAALGAWLYAIHLLIEVGKAKGYAMENAASLWIVGIFATPIIVGLYVAALPDNRIREAQAPATTLSADIVESEESAESKSPNKTAKADETAGETKQAAE